MKFKYIDHHLRPQMMINIFVITQRKKVLHFTRQQIYYTNIN